MRAPLSGVVIPVCTPLSGDGTAVDVTSLRRHLDRLVTYGVDGVFVLGTSGEFGFLTDEQRRRVLEVTVDEIDGRVPVLVGISDTATARALAQAEMLVPLGADGVVATAPFFAATGPMEIREHFRGIRREIGQVPLFAYENPGRVNGTSIPADLAIDLAGDGTIQGVKDSSGNRSYLEGLLRGRQRRDLDGFGILSGSEVDADWAILSGADGLVPGLGNVDPRGYIDLVELARGGHVERAGAEQERLRKLFGIVSIRTSEPMGDSSRALGAFKAAMKMLGAIDHDPCAPPSIRLGEEDRRRIEQILQEHGPEDAE